MNYLNLLLNVLLTLFALSIVMVSLLFMISGDDVAKTQKKFISQVINDLKTVWIFGGFNMQQSVLANSNKSPELIEQEFDEKIVETTKLNQQSQRNKNDINAKLLKKAQFLILIFFLLSLMCIMYGVQAQAFTLKSSILTLGITFFLFLSEYIFYFIVIKPYTHSTTKILYFKTLNRFLYRNSSFNTVNTSLRQNNEKYCNDIKYVTYDI